MSGYVCRSCVMQRVGSAQHVVRRTFSSQRPLRAGTLPAFLPTSNAELDQILTTLRDTHFIPASLNKQRRKVIHDPKAKNELETNPISVQVGGEAVDLMYLERFKDVPARRPLQLKALGLMNSRQEWANLPILLTALVNSGAGHDTVFLERIIRRATAHGRFSIIKHCLSLPTQTGMSFKDDAVVKQVMKSLHDIGQKDEWAGVDVAMKHADSMLSCFEQEGNTRGKTPHWIVDGDPRIDPDVLGLYLQLAAVQAVKGGVTDEQVRAVNKWARRTVECLRYLKPVRAETDLTPALYHEFFARFPLWHGLDVASRVLKLEAVQVPAVEALLKDGRERLEEIVRLVEALGPHKHGGFGHQVQQAWQVRTQ